MKVIKFFIDRETKKAFNVGDDFAHENAERIAFLVEKGYLKDEAAAAEKSDEKPKEKKTAKTAAGKTSRAKKKG